MPSPAEEIKAIGESLKRDFEEFKAANDKRLSLIEKAGTAGADREAKVEKISESLTGMEEKIEKIQTAMNRAPVETDEKEAGAKILRLSSKAVQHFMKKNRAIQMESEEGKAYLAEMKAHLGEENPEYKALTAGSDPEGGYFVRPFMSSEISKKVFESSPMREVADSLTISTDAFEEIYDNDEPDSGWVGEVTTRSETDENDVGKIRIEAHELHASPHATQKLLDDSILDIEAWHAGKVSEKFSRDENTAFVSGNGVNKPRGFLSYTAGDGFNMVEQVNSGASGAYDGDDLIDLQDALLEEFQPGALWMMRRATWTTTRKLKDGNGQYLVSAAGDLTVSMPRQLLGAPVKLAADMPAVGASALAIAYGNFKRGYAVIDRVGIRVLRDPYTTKGRIIFYTTKRVGGGVRHFQAIKLLKLV